MLRAWWILPVCLPTGATLNAVGSQGNFLCIPTIHGKLIRPIFTTYTHPLQHGGLFCDDDGNIKKPFPNRPYCVDGIGNVGCRNKASGNVAICQTVLPGNEAMLIPTMVENSATLAIPGPEYWAGTAVQGVIMLSLTDPNLTPF